MKRYGGCFRELRESKNKSLSKAVSSHLSVAQLSKFERGDSNLSVDKLDLALEGINVTPEEYFYYINDYQLNYFERVLEKAKQCHIEDSTRGIRFLIEDEEKKALENPTRAEFHNMIQIVIKAISVDISDSFSVEDKEVKMVTDYLFSLDDEWGLYELFIFGNTIAILPINFTVELAIIMLKRSNLLKRIPKNTDIIIKILLNVCLHLTNNSELEKAKLFITEIELLLTNETKLFEKNHLMFIKGCYHYKNGEIPKGATLIETSIEILNNLDSKNLSQNYLDVYEGYKQAANTISESPQK